MRRIPLLQIGIGGVGQALIDQVLWFNDHVGSKLGFRFAYIGVADRSGAVVADERIPPAMLREALAIKRAGGSLADVAEGGPLVDWRSLLTPARCVVIDVTAQDGNEAGLVEAVELGHSLVLANKKPLCAEYHLFQKLTAQHQTRYEATVGAGLPVISTLRSLLDTGDVVERIAGCFSGTLGFLMTQIEDGQPFAAAVHAAAQRGWTEPDPRDDLSGMDVARKALILARTCGLGGELADVEVEALFPGTMSSLSRQAFLEHLPTLDEEFRARAQAAADQGEVLRYTAVVASGQLRVSLERASRDSAVGQLRGPDNLIVFHTQRYHEQPLIVRGPGAGVQVTAAAVLGDLIGFGREWR